jgi:hypothetical protein
MLLSVIIFFLLSCHFGDGARHLFQVREASGFCHALPLTLNAFFREPHNFLVR